MRVETVAFEAKHLFEMDLRPSEQVRLEADPATLHKTACLAQYGLGATLIIDDIIVGCFGFFEMWPRVYMVWAFPSAHVERYAMVYLRTVRRYIRAIEETHQPQRLQTTTVDDDQHNRWMRFLGFTNETPGGMPMYSVLGETFNTWAITYDDKGDAS